ncbi:origin recognition complex subunit 1-like isoform X2 [Mytilus trossulus]|uniref:origin recognition complex subunit 1-like isoform X2 n=1 Tax=Mytilus trossulus TaxID=6551 RepID=UPI0030078980
MRNCVGMNLAQRSNITRSLRIIFKRNKYLNIRYIEDRYISSQVTKIEEQTSECKVTNDVCKENDIYGINAFYESLQPRVNPEVSLKTEQLAIKYNIPNILRKKKYDTVQVLYGFVRLDPGVSNKFVTSQSSDENESYNVKTKRQRRKEKNVNASNTDSMRMDINMDSRSIVQDVSTQDFHSADNKGDILQNFSLNLKNPRLQPTRQDITVTSRRENRDYEMEHHTKIKSKRKTASEENRFSHDTDQNSFNSSLNREMDKQTKMSNNTSSTVETQYFPYLLKQESEESTLENSDLKAKSVTEESRDNFIDQQYFDTAHQSNISDHSHDSANKKSESFSETQSNIIDQQYFDYALKHESARDGLNENTNIKPDILSDPQFREDEQENNKLSPVSLEEIDYNQLNDHETSIESQYFNNLHTTEKTNNKNQPEVENRNSNDIKQSKITLDLTTEHQKSSAYNRKQTVSSRKVHEEKSLSTAEEAARKIRDELEDKSILSKEPTEPIRKKMRQNKEMMEQLHNMTSTEVVGKLYHSIVYDRDDVIAISKPYGMPCVDGPGGHLTIQNCLEKLKNHVDPELKKLHLITHLDRDSTGIILLAKTEMMAYRLTEAYKKNEVIKKFFVLTKGIPQPEEGVIDIPVAEGKIDGKYRMVLKPEGFNRSKGTFKAVTQYKVLATSGTAALVECIPLTSVKHQIRAHMFFGLNTPILGDHKYSHITKMAPQKIFPDMLTRLRIRQAEVRYLPLHLHARSLVIPEFMEGRNLNVTAYVPDFFVNNMKRLKLDFKKHL